MCNVGECTDILEAIGRTYLLAGDTEGALDRLRSATGSCGVLDNLFFYVRAHEELGEALAAKGDTDAACGELRVVLSYWGQAKPRSVTADAARAQMRRLRCSN
jgi:serine/threonine-protein kinase